MSAPRLAVRRLAALLRISACHGVIVALAACGHSTGPDKYPDMLGTYDLTVNGPYGSGTINITGQQDSTLTGDATIVLTCGLCDELVLTGFGVAAVQKKGSIRFNISPASPDEWTFSGHVNGSTMSGSQSGRGDGWGSWTATRR